MKLATVKATRHVTIGTRHYATGQVFHVAIGTADRLQRAGDVTIVEGDALAKPGPRPPTLATDRMMRAPRGR